MTDFLFFGGLVCYFVSAVIHFMGLAFRREKLDRIAWYLFFTGFALNSAFIVARGIAAHRIPLANQFEFATAFAWGIGLLAIILHRMVRETWLGALTSAAAFMIISFAALQPRTISDLMPALRSGWFSFHIGSAIFSYSSFMISACVSIHYLILDKKPEKDELRLTKLDHLSYRMIAFGFLMLTVTILTGCIWAEQAWGAFWTWDPKETWALITWLIYAAYLHLRLQKKWQGRRMAMFSIVGIVCVLFTFIGVNVLFKGLHSYK